MTIFNRLVQLNLITVYTRTHTHIHTHKITQDHKGSDSCHFYAVDSG